MTGNAERLSDVEIGERLRLAREIAKPRRRRQQRLSMLQERRLLRSSKENAASGSMNCKSSRLLMARRQYDPQDGKLSSRHGAQISKTSAK